MSVVLNFEEERISYRMVSHYWLRILAKEKSGSKLEFFLIYFIIEG